MRTIAAVTLGESDNRTEIDRRIFNGKILHRIGPNLQ
ncbi:MAG: hypothetical protein QOC70_1318 [Verrucomicrobiota bacterium]|jgi:hypothetical protein